VSASPRLAGVVAALVPNAAVEDRVLAEVLCVARALAEVSYEPQPDGLEVDDFYQLGHQWAFRALRNLQAAGRPCEGLDVIDEIEAADKREDAHRGDTCDALWLYELVTRAGRYEHTEAALDPLFVSDLRYLRVLAKARRAAMEALP
jgi:replicative DNA helicase